MVDRPRSASDVVLIGFRLTSNTGSLTINLSAHFIQLCKLFELSITVSGAARLLVLCNAEFAPIQIWV
jgi:hypothetical protein